MKLQLEIEGMNAADIERLKGNIIGSVENTFNGTCVITDVKEPKRAAKKGVDEQ